jgi:hypothetical protein
MSEWSNQRSVSDRFSLRLRHNLSDRQDAFTSQNFAMRYRHLIHANMCPCSNNGKWSCDVDCPIYVFHPEDHPPRLGDYLARSFDCSVKLGKKF